VRTPEPSIRRDSLSVRTFGEPPPDHPQPPSTMVHAIIVDGDRVLVLDDGTSCALPGGVPDSPGDPGSFLTRTVRAVTGHDLADIRCFQQAHQWATGPGGSVEGRDRWFYLADLSDSGDLSDAADHVGAPGAPLDDPDVAGTERSSPALPSGGPARWAPRDAALDLIDDEVSRWALSVALCADAVVRILTRPGSTAGT
jgi:hypothetical protein